MLKPAAALTAAASAIVGLHIWTPEDAALLGQLVVAAVTIIGFAWTSWQRQRDHRARTLEQDAQSVRLTQELELARAELAAQAATHLAAILSATEGAAAAAREAYHEANSVNAKIADLHQQRIAEKAPDA